MSYREDEFKQRVNEKLKDLGEEGFKSAGLDENTKNIVKKYQEKGMDFQELAVMAGVIKEVQEEMSIEEAKKNAAEDTEGVKQDSSAESSGKYVQVMADQLPGSFLEREIEESFLDVIDYLEKNFNAEYVDFVESEGFFILKRV